ncbi:hypothetical protein [Knoellia aerolata]|uniref:Uncharacterized protein n=1 Tax=Knoellia aerolata DSM 18566 TaxID=1385519 RepID=A0A0A0JVR4_9MICO|nr:hypothetical protein [Knoellia aerolata]KGN40162.1 hypothetical protein N801_13115 [Knoellia aerolata DSM 18566]
MPAPTLRRVAVTAATAALTGLGVVAVGPAHAASAELAYTCTLFSFEDGVEVDDLDADDRALLESAKEGDVPLAELEAEIPGLVEIPGLEATATFDSAIEDGATARAGSTVELEPVAASFTLSPEIGAELRALGITEGEAGAMLFAGIEETGLERDTEFYFDTVSIPESGPLTLSTEDGFAEDFRVNAPGTFTYVAGEVELFIAVEDEESILFAGLTCTPDEDQDLTIDQVVAAAAPTPTPTPTAPGPVRPDVVQTDAAQPTSPAWLPVASLGLGSILVVGAASRLRRRAPRH